MKKCIICIGSNFNRNENMVLARRKLTEFFPSICLAPECETEPLFFKNPALFSNQVAMFFTEKGEEEVKGILKEIERLSGRIPEDKNLEKVSLDIDLLSYGDSILKPEDMQREYIQNSVPMCQCVNMPIGCTID